MCETEKRKIEKEGNEKSFIDKSVREKEKWTNKGADKPYMADYLSHGSTFNA